MPCELEKYKILYQAYADEIRNLWTRSVFLGAFMTLAWGGYGALQLKILDKSCETTAHCHLISLGLCVVIIVLSLLWVAMAKGSKFVQEAHEEHIKNLKFDWLGEINIEMGTYKRLFCDLGNYQDRIEKKNQSSNELFSSYRYSPSKINIALGWVSVVVAVILSAIHIMIWTHSLIDLSRYYILFAFPIFSIFAIVIFMAFCMKDYLKGGNK